MIGLANFTAFIWQLRLLSVVSVATELKNTVETNLVKTKLSLYTSLLLSFKTIVHK